MSLRTFVTAVLKNDPDLAAVFSGRVLTGQSLMTAQQTKPYIVYKMMNDSDEGWDDPDVPARPHRQYFMVYIHDERPSYDNLDGYTDLVKNAFRLNPSSASDRITWITYLERSADFDDVTLDTVFRYLRFQAVMT
jgi:hypothetical protein